MEDTTCENVETASGVRESTIEDSTSGMRNPEFEGHNGPSGDDPSGPIENPRSQIENRTESIENRESKIGDGKRPYAKTPARLAAARANLEKARAAPKEKVYRRTDKRLAANRANLAKAQTARQKELEEVVDRLDMVFPPLGAEVPEEALGPEFLCHCGSGKTFHRCCKGRKPKTGSPGQVVPRDPPANPEEEESGVSEVRRVFFRYGSPKWVEEGVDREAADYGALEKAGRALLYRQRALLNEARREGREVMRLLTQAAERTIAPTLQDILTLASSLMTLLGKSRLLGRTQRLNRRVKKLLEAFVEKRYERSGRLLVTAEACCERLMAEADEKPSHRLRDPECGAGTGWPGLRLIPKSRRDGAQGSSQHFQGGWADQDPDLPEVQEEFVCLVRRAFCAPHPEPEEEEVRDLVDELAGCLWNRLHTFDLVVKGEKEQLNQRLDQMADTVATGPKSLRERFWSIEAELEKTVLSVETMLQLCGETLPQPLGTLMYRRYGPHPKIDRFCSASFEPGVGNRELPDCEW
jgi:hypothetical protein